MTHILYCVSLVVIVLGCSISGLSDESISLEEIRKQNLKEMAEHNQAILNSATYQISAEPPDEFKREHYVDAAETAKRDALNQRARFVKLERKRYGLKQRDPKAGSDVVKLRNARGKLAGMLIYIGNRVYQTVGMADFKPNGITSYFDREGNVKRVLTYKDGELHGPFYEFISLNYPFPHEEKDLGNLVQYVEFESGAYKGLCLG